MTPALLLLHLGLRGVTVRLEGGRVTVRGPWTRVPPDLRTAYLEAQSEIEAYLWAVGSPAAGRQEPDPAPAVRPRGGPA